MRVKVGARGKVRLNGGGQAVAWCGGHPVVPEGHSLRELGWRVEDAEVREVVAVLHARLERHDEVGHRALAKRVGEAAVDAAVVEAEKPSRWAAGRDHRRHRRRVVLELRRRVGRREIEVRARPELCSVAVRCHVDQRHEDIDKAAGAVDVEGLRASAWPRYHGTRHEDARRRATAWHQRGELRQGLLLDLRA